MPGTERIAIWGAGGHARVAADIIRRCGRFQIAGFIDDVASDQAEKEFYGAPLYVAPGQLLDAGVRLLAVAIGDNQVRLARAEAGRQAGFALPALIDPSAIISDSARIEDGTMVGFGAIINAEAAAATCAIINTGAIVEHDCVIAEGAHIAPGAILAGHVTVGRKTLIGAGATLRDRVCIGDETVIGAGAVVVSDIPENSVAYGVPARVVRRHEP